MSLWYDLAINCDLREDTPEDVIQGLKCLTDRNYELKVYPQFIHPRLGNIWDTFYDKHFLASDPEREILSQFRRMYRTTIPTENNREVYRYSLQYIGRNVHEDFFAEHHRLFIMWLEIVCHEEYFGYELETTGSLRPVFLKVDPLAPHRNITDEV